MRVSQMTNEQIFEIAAQRLREMKEFFLRNPPVLDMGSPLVHNCNSVGCIAGWMVNHYVPPRLASKVIVPDSVITTRTSTGEKIRGVVQEWRSIETEACKLLGFVSPCSSGSAGDVDLFYTGYWPAAIATKYGSARGRAVDCAREIITLRNSSIADRAEKIAERKSAAQKAALLQCEAVGEAIEWFIKKRLLEFIEDYPLSGNCVITYAGMEDVSAADVTIPVK